MQAEVAVTQTNTRQYNSVKSTKHRNHLMHSQYVRVCDFGQNKVVIL